MNRNSSKLLEEDPVETQMPPLVHVSRDRDGKKCEIEIPNVIRAEARPKEVTSPFFQPRVTETENSAFEHHCKYSFMRSHLSRLLS